MRKLTLCFALFLIGCHPSQRADQGVQITTPVTIVGLPDGCTATASGNVITVTGCPVAPPVAITVTSSCANPTTVVGKTTQCSASVTNATDQTVNWSSTSPSVATVDSNGLVTGVAIGTANVVATAKADPTKSSSILMEVTNTPGTVTMDATNPIPTSNAPVSIVSTGDPTIPGVQAKKLNLSAVTQYFDYQVTIPVSANYKITARLGTDAAVTSGGLIAHFELPVGSRITTPLTLNGVNQWTTLVSGQIFFTRSGTYTIRFVVDQLPTTSNGAPPAFIHWFQVVPATAVASHSVTLNWTPGQPTDPSLPECQNVICPLPSGAKPCYATSTGFNVYRSQTSGSYSPNPVAASGSPFLDNSVQASLTYYYKVTGTNPTACTPESTASNEVKVVIPGTKYGKDYHGR